MRAKAAKAAKAERAANAHATFLPEVFENPDALDIGRREKSHLSFGRGIHYCLGASLAVLEARVAFAALLDRFASIRLATEPRHREAVVVHGVEHLWIEVQRTATP